MILSRTKDEIKYRFVTFMLYSYEECKLKLGSDYQIKKAIADGNLYRREKGVYSDEKYVATNIRSLL